MVKNRIGMLRKEQGLNQRELGEKLGVGQTTISAWETGKNEPDGDSLNKMAQLFHVSVGYLLGFEAESFTRGLPLEEHQKYIIEAMEAKERERDIREAERMAQQEYCDLTEEEIEELVQDSLYREWQASGLKELHFEVYQIHKMSEYLNKEQRQRALEVLRQMFPNAVRGKYTDEIAR